MRKSSATARAVGSYVPRLTRTAIQKFGFSAATLLTDWATIVGPDLARHTRPQKLKWPRAVESYGDTPAEQAGRPGATLHLNVDAVRALDVQYKGRQIIERINAYFGYCAVVELRLVQVPLAAEATPLPRAVVAAKPRPSLPGPDLGAITDDRLRAAFERMQKGMAKR